MPFERRYNQKTMNITELLESIAEQLVGKRAFIQVQIENEYYTKRVGDLNELVDHPDLIVKESTAKFIDWMEAKWEEKQLSYRTRLNHRSCIRLLRKWNEGLTFADLSHETVLMFDRWLMERHYKTNTISKIMGTWRQYVRMALDDELIVRDPFRRYKMRSEKTHKEHLTERDVRKIEDKVDELDGTEKEVARGFLFSIYTGLRYSDVCSIKSDNIRKLGTHKWMYVKMKKTKAEVKIPLDKMFSGKALKLLEGRGHQFKLPSNSRTNMILSKIMRKCGIRKHITMHCGRVTCATLCLSRGMPITTIQHILGHRDVNTTARVYAHLTDGTMLRDISRCWRSA